MDGSTGSMWVRGSGVQLAQVGGGECFCLRGPGCGQASALFSGSSTQKSQGKRDVLALYLGLLATGVAGLGGAWLLATPCSPWAPSPHVTFPVDGASQLNQTPPRVQPGRDVRGHRGSGEVEPSLWVRGGWRGN